MADLLTVANAANTAALPPLPALFGNPVLRDTLVEIQPAADIDWWPQTPGWYVLFAVLLFAAGRLAWRHGHQWLRNRYRREALQRLNQLPDNVSPVALNELLKMTAIIASSRTEVAALSGAAWGQWLSTRTENPVFSAASLKVLSEDLYRPVASEAQDLRDEVRAWLLQHRDDHAPA